jgi:hypothetical protein
MVTAGLHAGLAWQLRTDEDGTLPMRITTTTVKTLRMHVEAAADRPDWLPILRHQVASLQALLAPSAEHSAAASPSGD